MCGSALTDFERMGDKRTDGRTDGRMEGRTDGRTDGWTDGPIKRGVESRSTRLIKEREKKENKAGNTATSCGRVGRSGNARFDTFRLMLTDRPTDGRTDGWTDKAGYRLTRAHTRLSNSPSRVRVGRDRI